MINQVRGLLAEYGIVVAKGPSRLTAEGPAAVADASLSDLARELFAALFDQLSDVERRIGALDARLVAICRENAASRRLAAVPGVGRVIATALVASIDDGRHCRGGRELAAWIGLVPRQHTTGGKPKDSHQGQQQFYLGPRRHRRMGGLRVRLQDDVRKIIVFLGFRTNDEKGSSTIAYGGTGFFVTYHISNMRSLFCYLVTCRHVAEKIR